MYILIILLGRCLSAIFWTSILFALGILTLSNVPSSLARLLVDYKSVLSSLSSSLYLLPLYRFLHYPFHRLINTSPYNHNISVAATGQSRTFTSDPYAICDCSPCV